MNISKVKEPKEAGFVPGKPLTVANDQALDDYFGRINAKRRKTVKKHVLRKKSAKKA